MWPKLNRGKTTEAMSVVLISLDYVSPVHLAVKNNLPWAQGFGVRPWQNFWCFFKYNFRAFLIVTHQNKCHFWNLEAKLVKIGMLSLEWFFCVWRFNPIWPDLDLTLTSSWVRRKNECFHRILRPKWPIKHVPQQHSHNIFIWLNRWGYT